MGAIVMLTSDTLLKWLIVLNLMALLSIAIMVVPEKRTGDTFSTLQGSEKDQTRSTLNLYLQRTRGYDG